MKSHPAAVGVLVAVVAAEARPQKQGDKRGGKESQRRGECGVVNWLHTLIK
jgi:hypothetical protein